MRVVIRFYCQMLVAFVQLEPLHYVHQAFLHSRLKESLKAQILYHAYQYVSKLPYQSQLKNDGLLYRTFWQPKSDHIRERILIPQ